MIDFTKLATPFRVVVPVWGNEFLFHKKLYRLRCRNGWFEVEITNNRARPIGEALPQGKGYRFIQGFTHNNSIIFQNFDVAKRNYRLSMRADLRFNNSQTFEAIKAIVWEDGNVYWVEPDYSSVQIFSVKDVYDREGSLQEEKGVTPEMRSLFLFHSIERDQLKQIQLQEKLEQDHKRIMEDLPSRLRFTFSQAGAELINYSLSGQRIIVDWRMPGSEFKYNSVINSENFMILEAGYCMSNDDKRHNITSMVKTAEEYEQKDLTYITRR